MPDYYKILAVDQTASPSEIEMSIENQYNQVRRLTTHYDANIVNQANQALLILEQARTILLDPVRRTEYDASLGIGIGGIADPESTDNSHLSIGTVNPSSPLVGFNPPVHTQPVMPTNVWVCPKCQQPNPMGTQYCQNCRQIIGRICPDCQASYEAKANFCPNCGQSFEAASRRAQLSVDLNQKRTQRYSLVSQATAISSPKAQFLEYLSIGGTGWAIFMGLITVHFFLATILRLVFSLFNFQQLGQPVMIGIIQFLSVINILLRWAIWVGVLGFFVYVGRQDKKKLNLVALAGYGFLSLLALAFGGPNFSTQVLGSYGTHGNSWLIFPALVSGALITGGWLLLRDYSQPSLPFDLNIGFLNPLKIYFNKLVIFYENSPLVVAGIGAGLCLFTLLFSASASIISIIAAFTSIGACAVLAVLSYRASAVTEVEKTNFLSTQKTAKNNLMQLDAEIVNLEQQVKDLSTH